MIWIARVAGALVGIAMCVGACGEYRSHNQGRTAWDAMMTNYDASRRGSVLSVKLRRSGLCMRPSRWRQQQMLVLAGVLGPAFVVGVAPMTAVGIGVTVVRAVSVARMHFGRRHHAKALIAVAGRLGRALHAELLMQRSLADAIVCASTTVGEDDDVLRRLLERAAARVRLGESGGVALRGAGEWVAGEPLAVDSPLSHVIAVCTSAGMHRARASSLLLVTRGLEADEQHQSSVTAALSESRFVSVIVPVLTLILGAVLVSANPASLSVLNSGLGIIACLACVVIAVSGVATVLRLTAT